VAAASDILSAHVAIPGNVVRRAFVDQSVALNLSTGQYYALNVTAARMFEALAAAGTAAAAVPVLAQELGQSEELIASSLAALCRDLAERGLVELRHADDG
jgi:hypothetical protein